MSCYRFAPFNDFVGRPCSRALLVRPVSYEGRAMCCRGEGRCCRSHGAYTVTADLPGVRMSGHPGGRIDGADGDPGQPRTEAPEKRQQDAVRVLHA